MNRRQLSVIVTLDDGTELLVRYWQDHDDEPVAVDVRPSPTGSWRPFRNFTVRRETFHDGRV
jgi:hypothetical protein